MTPYKRAMVHPNIDDHVKTALREQHADLNPL